MEIILLERQANLGNIGDIIKVKNGYARNYLLPNKIAVIADVHNKEAFSERKAEIEKEFLAKVADAEESKRQIEGKTIVLIKQAGKDSRLYGSVTSSDIVTAINKELGISVPKSVVKLNSQIKLLGRHNINLNLFADVNSTITALIARSQEEAEQEIERAKNKTESFEQNLPEVNEPQIEESEEDLENF